MPGPEPSTVVSTTEPSTVPRTAPGTTEPSTTGIFPLLHSAVTQAPTQWRYQCSHSNSVPDSGRQGPARHGTAGSGCSTGCAQEAVTDRNTRNIQGEGCVAGRAAGAGEEGGLQNEVGLRSRAGIRGEREPADEGKSHCTGFLGAAGTWEVGSSLQVGAHTSPGISLSLDGRPRGGKGVSVLSTDQPSSWPV